MYDDDDEWINKLNKYTLTKHEFEKKCVLAKTDIKFVDIDEIKCENLPDRDIYEEIVR